jgi:hypothetical protein
VPLRLAEVTGVLLTLGIAVPEKTGFSVTCPDQASVPRELTDNPCFAGITKGSPPLMIPRLRAKDTPIGISNLMQRQPLPGWTRSCMVTAPRPRFPLATARLKPRSESLTNRLDLLRRRRPFTHPEQRIIGNSTCWSPTGLVELPKTIHYERCEP